MRPQMLARVKASRSTITGDLADNFNGDMLILILKRNKYYLLSMALSSARTPRWVKCAVDRATMSVLVIMPVSLPACENMMCRSFYGQRASVGQRLSADAVELANFRNMFTTSSSGTSFRNCMASSNSGDRSAESPSCGPRKLHARLAPPVSDRRGSA